MDSNGHAIFHGGQYGNGAGTAGFVPREPKSMDSVTAAAVAAAAAGGSGAGAAAAGGGGGGGAECVNSFGNMEILLSVAAATGHTTSATASASGTSNSRYNSHGHRLENNSTHHSHGHAHGHNLQHASSFISGSDASFKLDGCFRRPAVAAQVQPKNNNTDEEAALRAGSWHHQQQQQQQHRQHDTNMETLKSRIASHPRYPQLMAAFMDCSKIGASPEVAALMEQKLQHCKSLVPSTSNSSCAAPGASDPELDLFMNDYCELLIRYEAELSGPYKEAMEFVHKMQVELHSLGGMDIEANSPGAAAAAHGAEENGGNTSEEEEELNCNFMETTAPDSNNHSAESKELKEKLLRKYSGCFGNLRKEFLKKKKKGKLPKNARQKLLDWWDAHYKWPYPCELDKAALAESTGLDQKQINNWFINQRKRHWKPSEDMQLVILDSMNPHASYTVGTAAMEW